MWGRNGLSPHYYEDSIPLSKTKRPKWRSGMITPLSVSLWGSDAPQGPLGVLGAQMAPHVLGALFSLCVFHRACNISVIRTENAI